MKITTLICLFISNFALSQEIGYEIQPNKPLSEYTRVITYYDLLEEILFCKDTVLVFENVFVQVDDYQKERVDSLCKSELVWSIEPEVIISHSNFGYDYNHIGLSWISFSLKGLNFKRELKIYNCIGIQIFRFTDCGFNTGFRINSLAGSVFVENCKIRKEISIGDNSGRNVQALFINNCNIELKEWTNSRQRHAHLLSANNEGGYIHLENSKIYSSDTFAFLGIHSFEGVLIENCNFLLPVVFNSYGTEVKSLKIKNTKFKRVSFSNFPEPSEFVCQWTDLRGCLANDTGFDSLIFFDGRTSELSNVYAYDELMSRYKELHEIYKTRGDMKSANGCYIEMKDVETRRLLYIYETEGGMSNYFTHKLNVWLGIFADYGTNPVKCILYAIKVILFFAFFYLLFFSKWDNINNKFMLKRSQTFIHFFKADQKREEIYSDTYKEHINSFENFKKSVQEAKGQIPFFFFLFLRPVYWTARRKIIINEWFYNRLDFTRKSWASLTNKQRLGYGTFYFGALMIYGLYLLMVKLFTALVISFNSFSSLGFGSLSLSGVTRYLAMVEGFIGWLLLSVFSISLFSQIIQG